MAAVRRAVDRLTKSDAASSAATVGNTFESTADPKLPAGLLGAGPNTVFVALGAYVLVCARPMNVNEG